MDLLYDYQAFEMQSVGGVSRSYAELISHIKDENCNYILGIKESNNVYLNILGIASGIKPLYYRHKLLFGDKQLFKGQWRFTNKMLSLFGYKKELKQVNKDYAVKLLKKQKFDIFEPTFFDSYFLPFLKDKPFVMTVHDMIPELFPDYFARDDFQIRNKKILCPLAAHIHVPSKRTKEDLINILNISPDKITIIPHGVPDFIPDNYASSPIFDFPYILYVGERGGYKNYSLFIKECSYIIRKCPEIRVVCTGRGFSDAEQAYLNDLGIIENVIHHYATDMSLMNLYHYAVTFVYPSAYEGFGMPILEAFACDCPVMLNNASCFPEVAEDAAIYFDINIDGDLYEKFVDFYFASRSLRENMIGRGRAQASKYSWARSSGLLVDVYHSIV